VCDSDEFCSCQTCFSIIVKYWQITNGSDSAAVVMFSNRVADIDSVIKAQ